MTREYEESCHRKRQSTDLNKHKPPSVISASLVRSIDKATMRPACAETSNKGLCAGLSSDALCRKAVILDRLTSLRDRRCR